MTTSLSTLLSRLCFGAALFSLCVAATETQSDDMRQRYERAERFLPWNTSKLAYRTRIEPQWQTDGRLRYSVETPKGIEAFEIDPRRGSLASIDPELLQPTSQPARLSMSPTGKWAMRVREHNLYRVDLDEGVEVPLTTDGMADYGYAEMADTDLYSVTRTRRGAILPPNGLWSPDGRKFLTYRVDQRGVRTLPLVQSVVPGEAHQVPKLHTARIPFPGDGKLTLAQLIMFDVATGTRTELDVPPFMPVYVGMPTGFIWWSEDSRRFFYLSEERGYKLTRLYAVDAATGKSRVLVEERADKPIRNPLTESSLDIDPTVRVLSSDRVVMLSNRDGWDHLYLFDGRTGQLLDRLTQGQWNVRRINHIDARNGWIYFTATGRERGRDLYYAHLYAVRLDGSGLTLLTPEDADHDIEFSPRGDFFVDTYSTVATAPVTVLRDARGRKVLTLAQADITPLKSLGWYPPERIVVKAADNATTLYGTLYRPADFDPNKRYPIIDSIYAGAQVAWAPRRFLEDGRRVSQATAELGFIVLVLDARGTPMRSQAFQDVSYGVGFGAEEIVADHVAAIRQLAQRHSYIDITRVGIYGGSWGGYRAARAMFQFPDFFKVGVAHSGSHDNFLYVAEHERWFGMPGELPDAYAAQSNLPLAGRLRGKLMLVYGDTDDDVHPANTVQLADALIRANKDFDLLILPNRNHQGVSHDAYFYRRRWDYFVEHLLEATPPHEYPIAADPEADSR